jgi:fructose-specific phosphotransferase system IIC component
MKSNLRAKIPTLAALVIGLIVLGFAIWKTHASAEFLIGLAVGIAAGLLILWLVKRWRRGAKGS